MISVAILGIIATAASFSLRTSQYRDQLRTAARVVASDLRSLQARALAASNIKFCHDALGRNIVCENSAGACVDSCTAIAPAGVGIRLTKDGTAYDLFAKRDPSTTDWRESYAEEKFLTRDLAASGAQNVKVGKIFSPTVPDYGMIDVAFQRQNGGMLIDACPVGCTNQNNLVIRLTHTLTSLSIEIVLNKTTGRISIEE